MGVSGCGKSTIGLAVAKQLDLDFVDGDTLHPPHNIAKMARGEPLDDHDRAPWLEQVGGRLAEPGVLVACSSLKRAYRDLIRAKAGGPVTFLFLAGGRETLLARMSVRPGHFMPASLLDSQLATLEPPGAGEDVVTASIEDGPAQIVERFVEAVARRNARTRQHRR
ncbi:gluconokinase [Fulvimarina sp. 2208YS6-2-32]|uniref:Gluconokinase n=1 Tax=Fulvimarina uroteuthidis TaxID=3098149 RepID=A0ABU5HY51_9HYPH|nr:gluconokinase [Fulvimarina sp. 2208YS6-2-32]MDY8108064.1 gluconokinase [Fulvimarina sp. 2208YS6-2-32]